MKIAFQIACVLMFANVFASGAEPAYKIIAHPSVQKNQLTQKELASVFLGRTRMWEGQGKNIVLVSVEPDDLVMVQFLEQILRKSPSHYRAYWRQRLFSGKGGMPIECSNSADVLKAVASTPGAIGIVSVATLSTDVKYLKIN